MKNLIFRTGESRPGKLAGKRWEEPSHHAIHLAHPSHWPSFLLLQTSIRLVDLQFRSMAWGGELTWSRSGPCFPTRAWGDGFNTRPRLNASVASATSWITVSSRIKSYLCGMQCCVLHSKSSHLPLLPLTSLSTGRHHGQKFRDLPWPPTPTGTRRHSRRFRLVSEDVSWTAVAGASN